MSRKKDAMKVKMRRWAHFLFGDSPEEYFSCVRKFLWLVAVAVCCYFMIKQVHKVFF